MIRVYFLAVFFCLRVFAGAVGAADSPGNIDPWWILLHEPAVVEELKLDSDQREKYQALLDELDQRFFPLRNKPQEAGQAGLSQIINEARQKLKTILKPSQTERLTQVHLWRIGTQSLLQDDVAQRMRYSDKQQQRIQEVLSDTLTAAAEIQKQAEAGTSLDKQFRELQTNEQKKLLKLLTPEQQTTWSELLGPPFNLSRLNQARYKAPELVNSNSWINSAPLQLKSLHGKVIVVHFYACGCINCIHNYPSYRAWQEQFRTREFVMIGIHTPETAAERNIVHVRQKAVEEKLTFPILVDGNNENWNAWGNSMWPSVYVIDKRGYLRCFWPGELKWQGSDGETFLRERIEALLAEPAP